MSTRRCEGYTLIEFAIATVIGSVVLAAILSTPGQQQPTGIAPLELASAYARASDALQSIAFTGRPAARVTVSDSQAVAGQLLRVDRLAGVRSDGARRGGRGERRAGDAGSCVGGSHNTTLWYVSASAESGRSELYCRNDGDSNALPMVSDIRALFASPGPWLDLCVVAASRSTIDHPAPHTCDPADLALWTRIAPRSRSQAMTQPFQFTHARTARDNDVSRVSGDLEARERWQR